MVLSDKFTSSMSSTAVDKIVLTDCILTRIDALFFHVDITMLIEMASCRVEEQDHSEPCRVMPQPCRWSCCPGAGVEATLPALKRDGISCKLSYYVRADMSLWRFLVVVEKLFIVLYFGVIKKI